MSVATIQIDAHLQFLRQYEPGEPVKKKSLWSEKTSYPNACTRLNGEWRLTLWFFNYVQKTSHTHPLTHPIRYYTEPGKGTRTDKHGHESRSTHHIYAFSCPAKLKRQVASWLSSISEAGFDVGTVLPKLDMFDEYCVWYDDFGQGPKEDSVSEILFQISVQSFLGGTARGFAEESPVRPRF